MKRRMFLKNGLLVTAGAFAGPSLISQKLFADVSAEIAPRFFVQISMTGGWMTNLSVDPWISSTRPDEKDAFIEYREDEILKEGNLSLGPAMAPMRAYAQNMNIINGIFVAASDGGHTSAEVYMQTGIGSGLYGNIAVEHELSQKNAPLGVLFNTGVYKGSSVADSFSIYGLETLTPTSANATPFDSPNSPIVKAQKVLSQNASKISTFNASMQELRNNGINLTDGHKIALTFKAGLAVNAAYQMFSGNLDTHNNHAGSHMTEQTKAWASIAEMLNAFKSIEYKNGISMFDVTTFYITSEFSRTPALNAAKGTDHNPLNNSAVIIGPKFKGNTSFGASRVVTAAESMSGSSYLVAQMVDIKTGEIIKTKKEAKEKGHLIRPETIIATLAEGLGIQRNIFPVVNAEEKVIAKILK